MITHIKVDYIIGLIRTNGTKRFHFYRNQYGVEMGWNIIPKKFGIFTYISHGART